MIIPHVNLVRRSLLLALPDHCLPASGGPAFLPAASSGASSRSFVNVQTPTRKPRGGELTAEQKVANQALASRRVPIEHVNSSVKRLRILKEPCRLFKEGVRDMVMEIGCALHNFRARITPTWQPLKSGAQTGKSE